MLKARIDDLTKYFCHHLTLNKSGIKISFDIYNNQAQGIDEYGMTDLDQISPNKDTNLADFFIHHQQNK